MQEAGYTQSKLLIADLKYKDEQPFKLLFTKVSIDLSICLFPKSMPLGGSRHTKRNNTNPGRTYKVHTEKALDPKEFKPETFLV